LSTGNVPVSGTYTADLLASGDGDQLAVTGSADITGATLALNVPNVIANGSKFTIIDNDTNADPIVGKFANLPNEGDTITANGQAFTISYVGGDGYDVGRQRVGAAAPAVTGF